MSLRGIVKKIFPPGLWPYLQIPYRKGWALRRKVLRMLNAGRMIAESEKYLPYYQDELSREILYDRIAYLRDHDNNIFVRRAEKEGWKFSGLYGIDSGKYSSVVVVYSHKDRDLDYVRDMLKLCAWPENCRFISLKEFLCGEIVPASVLIIAVLDDWDMIRLKNHMAAKNMCNDTLQGVFSTREEAQYVDVFSPREGEIIVDAGAYTGDTALRFMEWGGENIRHIYSFEFDPLNAAKCEENTAPFRDKITVIKKGIGSRNETVYISPMGSGSHVSDYGSMKTEITSIDSELDGIPATFIKMDVEGAELESLIGARNTITKYRPRLAICVYHKLEDIYEIPAYILSLVPEYKFYLRHYSSCQYETVLYASCE